LWKIVLRPGLEAVCREVRYLPHAGNLSLARGIAFPESDKDITVLPHAPAFRTLSRAGLLLNAAALRSRDALAPFLNADPFRIGIYCPTENGPNDLSSARGLIGATPEEFAAAYRSSRSAKQHFRQLPSVPAAQLSIFLGVKGPLNVFNHSLAASAHALDQAELDLSLGQTDAALVCAAFSLEDPIIAMRALRDAPSDAVLSEGAACLLLIPDGTRTDWRKACHHRGVRFHGVADGLIMAAGGALAKSSKHPNRSQLRCPPEDSRH
jgi:3-oxoacyl-(acyl-carrier-protein) synthase